MRYLLIVFLLSEFAALPNPQKTQFRTATRNLFMDGQGDRDTVAVYVDPATNRHGVICLYEGQADVSAAEVNAYRTAVTSRMPHATVVVVRNPGNALRSAGLKPEGEKDVHP